MFSAAGSFLYGKDSASTPVILTELLFQIRDPGFVKEDEFGYDIKHIAKLVMKEASIMKFENLREVLESIEEIANKNGLGTNYLETLKRRFPYKNSFCQKFYSSQRSFAPSKAKNILSLKSKAENIYDAVHINNKIKKNSLLKNNSMAILSGKGSRPLSFMKMRAFLHLYCMKRIFLAVLFAVFLLPSAFAQRELVSSTTQIVNAIALNNKYESPFVGFAGTPSMQYRNYQDLKRTATKEELAALLRHKNAVVRIYSFKSLYETDSKLAEKLSPKLLHDTATFMTLQGCIAGTDTVKTYVKRMLRNRV